MPFDPSSRAVDIILGLAALATLVTLIRHWRTFFDDDFTPTDKRLATQVAVFLIPPVVVLFHELGHYVTAKALGVRVIGFHYGLFEGSVTVAGPRTVTEDWLIAVSGNIVGAAMGAGMMVLGVVWTRARRPLRYVLLLGGLLEVLFSLVLYPLLSLSAGFGDWPVVYSGETPVLSAVTAVVHVGLLVGLYLWWRRRGRDALFTIGSGAETAVAELKAAVAAAASEPGPWLDLADFYARRGEFALARTAIQDGIEACGPVPRLNLGLTRLSMFQRRWNDAVIAARRGLDGGPADEEQVRQPLWANLALALTQMERPELALDAYAHVRPPLVDDPRLRYGRGMARMETGDADGRVDLHFVIAALPDGNLLRSWAEARLEGHALKEWGDYSKVPAHERPSGPPPPPVAGL
ncbi:MAG: hypothetical protein ACRD12_23755 [Acidimicrobiales bacterium]